MFGVASAFLSTLGRTLICLFQFIEALKHIVLIPSLHRAADSYQKIPGALMGQFKLSCQSFCRDTVFICCAKIDSPELDGKWKMCMVHDRFCSNRSLAATVFTMACATRFETVIFLSATLGANKIVGEAFFEQIVPAILFCRKLHTKHQEGNWCCF